MVLLLGCEGGGARQKSNFILTRLRRNKGDQVKAVREPDKLNLSPKKLGCFAKCRPKNGSAVFFEQPSVPSQTILKGVAAIKLKRS